MGGKGKFLTRKRKHPERNEETDRKLAKETEKEFEEFNLPTKHQLKTLHHDAKERRLIVILEGAQLETVKVFELHDS